ncbi:MAG: hypothetical protein J7J20_04665 [Desulfurococcales archaeon]|nr:hypothetical protein [Desulfurococcales archaeon]
MVCVDGFLSKYVEFLRTLLMLRGRRAEVLEKLCGEGGVFSKWRLAYELGSSIYAINKALKPLVGAGLVVVESKEISSKLSRHEVRATEGGRLLCKLLKDPEGVVDEVLKYLGGIEREFAEVLRGDPCGRELVAYAIARALSSNVRRALMLAEDSKLVSMTYHPTPIDAKAVSSICGEAIQSILNELWHLFELRAVLDVSGFEELAKYTSIPSPELSEESRKTYLRAYEVLDKNLHNELLKILRHRAEGVVNHSIERLCYEVALKAFFEGVDLEKFSKIEPGTSEGVVAKVRLGIFKDRCREELSKTVKQIMEFVRHYPAEAKSKQSQAEILKQLTSGSRGSGFRSGMSSKTNSSSRFT